MQGVVEMTQANRCRYEQGENHYEAKLTNAQVEYIRLNPESLSQYKLAEKFGVRQPTISLIDVYAQRDGGQFRLEFLISFQKHARATLSFLEICQRYLR